MSGKKANKNTLHNISTLNSIRKICQHIFRSIDCQFRHITPKTKNKRNKEKMRKKRKTTLSSNEMRIIKLKTRKSSMFCDISSVNISMFFFSRVSEILSSSTATLHLHENDNNKIIFNKQQESVKLDARILFIFLF